MKSRTDLKLAQRVRHAIHQDLDAMTAGVVTARRHLRKGDPPLQGRRAVGDEREPLQLEDLRSQRAGRLDEKHDVVDDQLLRASRGALENERETYLAPDAERPRGEARGAELDARGCASAEHRERAAVAFLHE